MKTTPRSEGGAQKASGSIDESISARLDRKNTRLLGVHLGEARHREVKILAAKESTTVKALLNEAIDLLFEKRQGYPDADRIEDYAQASASGVVHLRAVCGP